MASTIAAGRRFIKIYAALVGAHLAEKRATVLSIVALSGIGAVAQGGVVAFLVFAIAHFQDGTRTGIEQIDRLLGNDLVVILGFSLGLAVVMYTGAWASYRAVVATRGLARAFHQRCAARVLQTLYSGLIGRHPELPADMPFLRGLVLRGSNQLGNALESIVNLVEPLFRGIVALAILIFISPLLTLAVASALLLAVPVIYRATSRVHDDSRKFFDEALRAMFGATGGVLDSMISCNVRSSVSIERELPDFFAGTGPVRGYFDVLDRIQLANARTQFALSMITSGALVIVLLAVSLLASGGHISWPLALGYLVSLVHALQAVNSIRSHVTTLSVFYPSAKRHLLIRSGYRATDLNAVDGKTTKGRAQEQVNGDNGAAVDEIELRPGEPMFLVGARDLSVLGIEKLLGPLRAAIGAEGGFRSSDVLVLGPRARPLEWALGTPTGHNACRAAVGAALVDGSARTMGTVDLLVGLARRMDRQEDEAFCWSELDVVCRLTLLVSAVLSDTRRCVVIDIRWILGAGAAKWEAVQALLADRFLLLFSRGSGLKRQFAERAVYVADGALVTAGSPEFVSTRLPDKIRRAATSDVEAEDVAGAF